MTKTNNDEQIISKCEEITKAINEEKENIRMLQESRNSAILNAKNYEKDIEQLKITISHFQDIIHQNKPMQQATDQTNNINISNQYCKNSIFHVIESKNISTGEIICSVKISDDGLYFAFATYMELFLYKLDPIECVNKKEIPFDASCAYEKLTRFLTISPNSSFIGVCAADFSIVIFTRESLDVVGTIKCDSPCASVVAFFNDNSHIITSGLNGKVTLWSFPNCEKIKTASVGDSKIIVSIFVTAADSHIFAACSDGFVYVLSANLEEHFKSFHVSTGFVYGSSLSRDSKLFAITCRDREAFLFSTEGEFNNIQTFHGHSDSVICVEFSYDNKLLFTGSKDESLKVWDVHSGAELATLRNHTNTILSISHHPKEKIFVSCSGDGSLNIVKYNADCG